MEAFKKSAAIIRSTNKRCLGIIVPVVTASNRSVEDTLEPMLRSGRSSY
jgi:hypothetical protein